MATDVSLLGWSTLNDVIGNYSTVDARAPYLVAARVLDRSCPLIRYLPMVASNQILANVATRTDSIPIPSTRLFNTGVQPTASHNTVISDPMALFEAYSEVDKELWKIQNSPNEWRQDQDLNHVEGFVQLLESLLFYGSLSTDPGAFNGIATRFNSLSSYPNGDRSWKPNVWNGGVASGNATSAWFLELGKQKLYGIYPPNTPAGLNVENLGEVTKEMMPTTGAGPMLPYLYQVLRTHLTWRMGIQIQDERCVQRVANINPVPLSASGGNFDENIFIQAKNNLPSFGEGAGTIILVNRDLKTQIDIRAVSQKLNAYTYFSANETDVFGRSVTKFQNIPILVSEKISSTETIVS